MNIITDASLPAHVFVAGRAVVAHYDYLHRGEGAWYRVRVESERDTAWDCADPDTDTDTDPIRWYLEAGPKAPAIPLSCVRLYCCFILCQAVQHAQDALDSAIAMKMHAKDIHYHRNVLHHVRCKHERIQDSDCAIYVIGAVSDGRDTALRDAIATRLETGQGDERQLRGLYNSLGSGLIV